MATYVRKSQVDILRQATAKLETQTPIRATAPGSIARAFTEAITTELGDYYDILDYNMSQSVVSTASGRALDLWGELFNTRRKTVSDLVATSRTIGAFYFYLDQPYGSNITIPAGTLIYTNTGSFVGRQFRYITTEAVTIPAGTTRRYASIRPDFADAAHTAAEGSLTVHNFTSPAGVRIRCTNPKAIAPQTSFESDESYRSRIIAGIRTTAGGTIPGLRFTALNVSGVRDVRVNEAKYGMGSVEVIVTAEDATLSTQALVEVTNALEDIRPPGVRMIVRQPELLPFSIDLNLVIVSRGVSADSLTARRAQTGVYRYLNTLRAGDTLVFYKLLQEVLDSSDSVRDVIVSRYAPNGVEAPRKNYTPKPDELIIPGTVNVYVS